MGLRRFAVSLKLILRPQEELDYCSDNSDRDEAECPKRNKPQEFLGARFLNVSFFLF